MDGSEFREKGGMDDINEQRPATNSCFYHIKSNI